MDKVSSPEPGNSAPADIGKYAVLFRVHSWDDFVERNYVILRNHVGPSGDVWIVSDETSAPVATPTGLPKFSLTGAIMETLGLPRVPEKVVFWWNNDFGLYPFYLQHPNYSYYIIVEHDVAVLTSIDNLIELAISKGADFIGAPISCQIDQWEWTSTCTEIWPKEAIRPHLVCFCVFSARAAPALLASRRQHGVRFGAGEIKNWPFAEAFVATQVNELGFTVCDLNEFANLDHYAWWPPTHSTEIYHLPPGSIVHPVMTGVKYIESLLRWDGHIPTSSWFTPNSLLRRKLNLEAAEQVLPALARTLKKNGDFRSLFYLPDFIELSNEQLVRGVVTEGMDEIIRRSDRINLAFGKTAVQSSVAEPAPVNTSTAEVEGALDDNPSDDYVFHTVLELNPWWMLDLDDVCVFDEIVIYNRLGKAATRANNITVWHSTNGRRWRCALRRVSSIPFGGRDGFPLRIRPPVPEAARYVRIEVEGISVLHLNRVEVFGWPLSPTKA